MRFFGRPLIFVCLLITILCLISCEKKKEGKVIVTAKDFVLRQDAERSWTIDATGKVKNVGEADVKKVVITGYCRSCGEIIVQGSWFVSDIEKLPHQKDTISYLAAGVEEEFSVKEVVFYWGVDKPESIPEKLEIVIESFETVNN
jgi:hypothetical protein